MNYPSFIMAFPFLDKLHSFLDIQKHQEKC